MIKETILKVPDIVCDGCAASIKKAFGSTDGVTRAAVDVKGKTVSIEHDEKKISRERIVEKLDDIGFSVE